MTQSILNTMFYLMVVLWGIPTIYFGTSTTLSNREMKKQAIRIYPALLFLVLLITVIVFGVDNTKKAISYAFGEVIFFIFFTVIIIGLIGMVLLLMLGNYRYLFEELKRKLNRKK